MFTLKPQGKQKSSDKSVSAEPESPNVIEQLDPELISQLEEDIEYYQQQSSAYEIVCAILSQSMLIYDLQKFREYRQTQMQKVLSDISLSNINHSNELN
jgi:hypothetical protein